jgi:hypothetical protein
MPSEHPNPMTLRAPLANPAPRWTSAAATFPNCPRTSIYEASERDFRIVLARDAISGLYERGEGELINIDVGLAGAAELAAALAR